MRDTSMLKEEALPALLLLVVVLEGIGFKSLNQYG